MGFSDKKCEKKSQCLSENENVEKLIKLGSFYEYLQKKQCLTT